jgi:hypothetical protein
LPHTARCSVSINAALPLSFPGGFVYPGVVSLYEALGRGPSDRDDILLSNIVFLTARPQFLGQRIVTKLASNHSLVAEGMTHSKLHKVGKDVFANAVVLAGNKLFVLFSPFSTCSLCSSGSFATAFKNSKMAAKKHANYLLYKELYPECKFTFVGDSGQGDVQLGLAMLAEEDAKKDVRLFVRFTSAVL